LKDLTKLRLQQWFTLHRDDEKLANEGPQVPKPDSLLSAQFRPLHRNEYGDRRSGSFQATVTTFGTTTTGWEADIRMSFVFQLVLGRKRTIRF
jgi:hypothetical protein